MVQSIRLLLSSFGKEAGACPGFLKGGSNIVWFPKKSHQGEGSNGLIGEVQYISLPRTTNLAYLDAKGIFKLKLPSQAQG